jgi:RNA polymerase sigma-70 factor, ECF subfamily
MHDHDRRTTVGPRLSDEPTMELVARAQRGDNVALEALIQRCLPPLKRWAHGRLPAGARDLLDTNDLVQDAVMNLLRRLDRFEPRHVGAMQAYLRQSIINRIRDEVRRIARRPPPIELPDDQPSQLTSPLENAIRSEDYVRYRRALADMRAKDSELIVARIEMQWSAAEIAHRFGLRSVEAARMALTRALQRLTQQLQRA